MANGPNIFQMLLVFLNLIFVLTYMFVPIYTVYELCNMSVDSYFSVTSVNQINKVK